MRFFKNLLKDIWAKIFFSSVVEKSDVLFAKAPPRKGCFSDLRWRGAFAFLGNFFLTKRAVSRRVVGRSVFFFEKQLFNKGRFF